MNRTRRRASRRFLSTPNGLARSPQSADNGNHSEPVTHTRSSSQEEVQTIPTTEEGVNESTRDEVQVESSSLTRKRPRSSYWTVDVIGIFYIILVFWLIILYFH